MEAEEGVQTGQLRVARKHPTKLIKQSVNGEVKLHREHGESREIEKQKGWTNGREQIYFLPNRMSGEALGVRPKRISGDPADRPNRMRGEPAERPKRMRGEPAGEALLPKRMMGEA
ncbi:hypothetical protein WR25_03280 [Diploscapter pachys]|uniref:Uncharacterized protein n=1 Tax=Diploscapter pachys TaxID=2018661 RepID=A0A2A2JQS2_9BILA|nr:hypothetical protein WR25_03280 [Diploscapter pachys]